MDKNKIPAWLEKQPAKKSNYEYNSSILQWKLASQKGKFTLICGFHIKCRIRLNQTYCYIMLKS